MPCFFLSLRRSIDAQVESLSHPQDNDLDLNYEDMHVASYSAQVGCPPPLRGSPSFL